MIFSDQSGWTTFTKKPEYSYKTFTLSTEDVVQINSNGNAKYQALAYGLADFEGYDDNIGLPSNF